MKYYVYKVVARQGNYKGQVVYVGKGKGNRLNHCLSGCSSSKELNRYYFLNGEDESVSVSIVKHFKTDKEALEYEVEMIKELRPLFNKKDIIKPAQDYNQFFKSFEKCLIADGLKVGTKLHSKYISQVKGFISFYTMTKLLNGCRVSRLISKNSGSDEVRIFTNLLMRNQSRPIIKKIFKCELKGDGEAIVTLDLSNL